MLALGGLEPVEVIGDSYNAPLDAAVAFFQPGIAMLDDGSFAQSVLKGGGIFEEGDDFGV